jgi:dihydroneopterin aldolase
MASIGIVKSSGVKRVARWQAGELLVKPGARLYIGAPVRRANTMDIVFISDLRIETIIGIYDWERKIKQTISLDLEMGADIRRAAATDAIEDTLNYKAVSKRLIEFVGESEYQLVETLAEKVAEIVTGEFNVPWLRLTVHKPGAVRGSRDVGVIIERGSRG